MGTVADVGAAGEDPASVTPIGLVCIETTNEASAKPTKQFL